MLLALYEGVVEDVSGRGSYARTVDAGVEVDVMAHGRVEVRMTPVATVTANLKATPRVEHMVSPAGRVGHNVMEWARVVVSVEVSPS